MKWITRERPKIDRIACPWLIKRFIDRDAQFLYVPKEMVKAEAERESAIPYDVPGVELTHVGERCSFDKFVEKYEIRDPAVLAMAEIVRAADTDTLANSPQAAGLLAITLGLGQNFQNDHELLKVGMTIYDALYTWAKSLKSETHGWYPEKM